MIYDISKLPNRFRSKIVVNEDGCWTWDANKRNGYGIFSVNYTTVGTHRFAYEYLIGPIPKGYEIDHFRMNPGPRNAPCSKACCNPDHLEAVTKLVNMQRGRSGQNPNSWAHNSSKTHCLRGHPYDQENTYYQKGGRACRACHRAWNRAWKERKKAKTL